MNDLDLIHQRGNGNAGDVEATFMLPVKSESTMSLYRLNVERDVDQMVMTPSKSENNVSKDVNGDSGFDSGAQSTNPVWSGFLCRKPSDPFWNMRKPTVATAVSPTKNYPGLVHPRMRKIPWISAWKKLDGNSDSYKRPCPGDVQSKDNKNTWNDPTAYSKKIDVSNALDNHVTTIEEEMSDVGTPSFNGDYNLNIFAKESGVLLENAFGKIERDDRGVKVNFYGENVQYDAKDGIYGNKESMDNIFDSSFESDKPYDSNRENYKVNPSDINKVENYYEPLNVKKKESNGMFLNDDNVNSNEYLSDEIPAYEEANNENVYKCELRLNGGHYENLFGTKENIFAQCDQYKGKTDASPRNSKLERRASGRRDSGRLRKPNTAYYHLEANSLYGQLKKAERKESFTRKSDELPELRNSDIARRESDNKGKNCGIKRRESKTRNDRRPEIPRPKTQFQNSNLPEFDNREIVQDDRNRNKIEIEMKSVYGRNDLNYNGKINKIEIGDDFRINLNRRESQNRKSRDNSVGDRKSMLDNLYSEILDERGVKVIRRESQSRSKERGTDRKMVADDCERIYTEPKDILWQNRLERRESGRQVNVERSDSGRRVSAERSESGRRVSIERKNGVRRISIERSESGRQANVHRKDSGRSANVERRNSDRCANIERRESGRISRIERRESSSFSKPERKDSRRQVSNIYNRRDEIKNGVHRKDSQNRKSEGKNEGLWVNAIPFSTQNYNEEENENSSKRESRKEAYDLNRSPRKTNIARKESRDRKEKPMSPIKRKVSANRGKKEKLYQEHVDDTYQDNKLLRKELPKWPPKNDDIKSDSHFDDFIKYRDKCEDNFSHIKNINRETSAEREQSKMEQFITYGKLNGNLGQNGEIFPFDTFQEQKRPLFQSSKPVSDINDNCGQKKLAITDFL